MQIQYTANGSKRHVRDSVGAVLVARGIARNVTTVRDLVPEPAAAPVVVADPQKVEAGKVSPRTGKAKRTYKRRDMSVKA